MDLSCSLLLEPNHLHPTVFGCQATDSIPPQVSSEESLRPFIPTPSRPVGCLTHNAKRQAEKLRRPPSFYVFGVMRSGIEPRPPAPHADVLTTMLRRGGPGNMGITCESHTNCTCYRHDRCSMWLTLLSPGQAYRWLQNWPLLFSILFRLPQ